MAQRSYFSQCGDRNEPLTFAPEKVISYGQDVVLRKADEGVAISVCAADRDQLDVFSIHTDGHWCRSEQRWFA
jgi:hypothetical protein